MVLSVRPDEGRGTQVLGDSEIYAALLVPSSRSLAGSLFVGNLVKGEFNHNFLTLGVLYLELPEMPHLRTLHGLLVFFEAVPGVSVILKLRVTSAFVLSSFNI